MANRFKPVGSTKETSRGIITYGEVNEEKGTQRQSFKPFAPKTFEPVETSEQKSERIRQEKFFNKSTGQFTNKQGQATAAPSEVVRTGTANVKAAETKPEAQTGVFLPRKMESVSLTAGPAGTTVEKPPEVPTPEFPLTTIGGATDTVDFGSLSDNDKMVEIGLKRAKGQDLSDEETRFLVQQTITPTVGLDVSGPAAEIEKLREELQTQFMSESERLKKERELLVKEEEARVQERLGRDIRATREAGERGKETIQTTLSFSGFGRSTKNAELQADVERDVREQESLLREAADREVALFRRQLEGEDAETLQPLQDQINAIRTSAIELQTNAALKTAELNAANGVNAIDAITNLTEMLADTAGKAEIDVKTSELLGYPADKFGNRVNATVNGQPAEIDVQTSELLGYPADKFGNKIDGAYTTKADVDTNVSKILGYLADAKGNPLQTDEEGNPIALGSGGATEDQVDLEFKLRKEFNDDSKDFKTIRDSYARVQAAAQDPSPAGDLALIFGFMKILDPNSAVREGEFANAENTGTIPQQIWGQYNKLVSGEGRIDETLRNDFLNRADILFDAQQGQHTQRVAEFTRLANLNNLRPEAIILDFSIAGTDGEAGATGAAGGNTVIVKLVDGEYHQYDLSDPGKAAELSNYRNNGWVLEG